MKKDNRFEIVAKEGSELKSSGLKQIIVDKETGVNYLWMKSGYAGGLTPLLDADGKPIIRACLASSKALSDGSFSAILC